MKIGTFWASFTEDFKTGYRFIFIRDMPFWVAGIGLGILAILIFLWRYPWGISSGYANWGYQAYYYLGLGKWVGLESRPPTPWMHPVSLMNIGMVIGSMGASMMKRQFATPLAPNREYVKGFIGGALMGIGSPMAGGCIEGGFYTALGVFSLGGFMMMIGLGLGSIVAVKYLIWELFNWPVKTRFKDEPPLSDEKAPQVMRNWQPYAGAGIYIGVTFLFYVYSALDRVVLGGMIFFGLWIGFFMQRARFCLQRTFRNPFMTGDMEMVKAVILSLIIYCSGSAVIKYGFFQPASHGVDHRFWLGSLLGGFLFGLGMVIAGACASSGLWRAGEGNTKIWVAILGFCVANPPMVHLVNSTSLGDLLGKGVYIPDILGWIWTFIFYSAFFIAWYTLAAWNEKSEKFVISV